MYETKPWLRHYGSVPANLEYPRETLFGALRRIALKEPAALALRFLGTSISYGELLEEIEAASRGLAALGIRAGDRVLVCLPNCPQAVISFYALTRLGAVSAMIHPLSVTDEIEAFAREASCSWFVTLNAFYPRFAPLMEGERGAALAVKGVVLCGIPDYTKAVVSFGFWLSKGRKIKKIPADSRLVPWTSVMNEGRTSPELAPPACSGPDPLDPAEMALILFSGGTTGACKGIMLSSLCVNALGIQTNAAGGPIVRGDSMLSILPVFHGFGLAVGIHAILSHGGTCILVPSFTPQSVAKLIKKWRPNFMAGVPTLYDALSSDPVFRSTPLGSFKGIFSGGDSLSREIKDRFEAVLRQNGGKVTLREGYGLTESVTANMLMPAQEYRERSIGVPYPDMLAKVIVPGTFEEAELGADGELCVAGPSLMLGYLDHPEETAETLKTHPDGRLWLHTGDLASMDEEGFFYFKQRLKRVIKTSGISVYPSQVEDVLAKHPSVRMVCVIGVPHPTQVQVPKAFVVVHEGHEAGPELEKTLISHAKAHLMPYACPRQVEFRPQLPLTNVGKVAYRDLEKSNAEQA